MEGVIFSPYGKHGEVQTFEEIWWHYGWIMWDRWWVYYYLPVWMKRQYMHVQDIP